MLQIKKAAKHKLHRLKIKQPHFFSRSSYLLIGITLKELYQSFPSAGLWIKPPHLLVDLPSLERTK